MGEDCEYATVVVGGGLELEFGEDVGLPPMGTSSSTWLAEVGPEQAADAARAWARPYPRTTWGLLAHALNG
jgi:hypothetical protein